MYALTTKARVKTRLGLTSTGFDDLLDTLILAVTDRMERMANRRFMLSTWTNELYDGVDPYDTRRTTLILKNAPVANIASIEYKSGFNSNPTWTPYTVDDYDTDLDAGILYFVRLPDGRRNIRVTYTAGYSGYSIGIVMVWVFNATPTGTVDRTNRVFTLPVSASQVVVYADGVRVAPENYTHAADTITFDEGAQPYSTISVDYLPAVADGGSYPNLPMDIVEVCEEAVVRLFKKRESEGRSSETFQESSITWEKDVFTRENVATIKNFRRSSFL